jgi:hypothetical protein
MNPALRSSTASASKPLDVASSALLFIVHFHMLECVSPNSASSVPRVSVTVFADAWVHCWLDEMKSRSKPVFETLIY